MEQLITVYPNLSQDEAINLVGKLASELQVERGVRKNVINLKENPGFRTEFQFDPITSELSLVVSGIDDVQYIDLIPIYLDSLVQLTLSYSSFNEKRTIEIKFSKCLIIFDLLTGIMKIFFKNKTEIRKFKIARNELFMKEMKIFKNLIYKKLKKNELSITNHEDIFKLINTI